MGIKAKEHRKKVAKRNESIKLQEKQMKKAQHNFLMDLIEKEKASGKFDKDNTIPGMNGPVIDFGSGPTI